MAFHPPPPPFDPHDAKALQRSAEQDHSNQLGLTQDLGHILGWIWRATTWPIRLVLRLSRRNKGDDPYASD